MDGQRPGLTELPRRTFPRLLAGLLATVLPITIVLAVLLTQRASQALTESTEAGLQVTALTASARVGLWAGNRSADLSLLAPSLTDSRAEARARLRELDRVRGAYDAVQLLDRNGDLVAASRPGRPIASAGEEWFAVALSGRPVLGDLRAEGDALRWIVAVPVEERERVTGVLAADLDVTSLYNFIRSARLGETGDATLVNDDGRKIITLRDGRPEDEAAMIARGALTEVDSSPSARNALGGEAGTTRHETVAGRDVVTGYAPVANGLGWAALVHQDEKEAFVAVSDLRRVAILVVLAALVLAVLFALFFARRTTKPLTEVAHAARRVADGDLATRVTPGGSLEIEELGGSFNSMVASLERLVGQIAEAGTHLSTAAAELSSAAEELSATTSHQTSAATQTSATMEELARTSQSIAETVSSVAGQTTDTCEALKEADEDMQRSSERILALADHVGNISGLLELIHEIADQTNLLALNAAIEAARAGEAGRGFSVVADEVRRLAERSKASAENIGTIIESTQSETNATVMAMESSSKQIKRGLDLMETVMESTDQVRLTTQQQGAATQEVVDTMESVTEASRQTSATAQQISASATALTDLVAEMRRAADVAGNHR
jgi:methyl-accepting chemotaxis protein